MADLDCSSFESALETSAAVLGVSPGPLLDRLRAFESRALPESEWRQHAPEDLLARHMAGADCYALPAPERITWFHATRVLPSVTFADGLLPLPSVHKGIKTYLDRLRRELPPRSERQNSYPAWGGRGRSSNEKINSPFEKGPHAFLVRDAIFRPHEFMSRDYLAGPEIVEDLCLGYGEEDAPAMYAQYQKATEPRIVVFRMPGAERPEAVGAALMYLHHESRGEELSIQCNTCFDGEGSMPRDAIIRIEHGAGLQAEYAAIQRLYFSNNQEL
jgi:hypothetical protein